MAENQMGHDGEKSSMNIDDIPEKINIDNIPDMSRLPTITKVPENIRSVNVKAYEPEMIAIGAFTYELRSKNHLKLMEEHKKRFLNKLLQRREEESAKDYVMAMKDLEERARICYSEPVSLSSNQFVVMMLLDACFIVELCRYTAQNKWNDPIFSKIGITGNLGRDLLLADNQLPFFVLQNFYNMTKTPEEDFHELISKFFSHVFQQALPRSEPNADEEINHLLGFVHKSLWLPRPKTEQAENGELMRRRCATELQEAGIRFEKIQNAPTLFYIGFDKGVMKISELTINDGTESLFRNLIVYQQYQNTQFCRLVDYIDVMDTLINTAKDVKILCESGILINYLGDEEVVAKMFNRLEDSVCLPPTHSYSEILKNVNEYCDRPWNKWMANLNKWMASLWHNYFKTPWAIISFFAALVLLIFTAAQTVGEYN